jgi:hypothetical protein
MVLSSGGVTSAVNRSGVASTMTISSACTSR